PSGERGPTPGSGGHLGELGGPVRQRGPRARPMRGPSARAEEVVAGAPGEERPAPRGVVACLRGRELTCDPDVVPVDGGGAVVAPPRPDRIREPLLLVA